jgi:hypothetical protein
VAIDHGALEAELMNASLQFVRCRRGVLQRQMGEACVTLGMFLNLAREKIISDFRTPDRNPRFRFGLHARRRD